MNIWRLRRGGGGGFVILDWRTLQSLAVTPDLDAWLKDPKRQPQALDWYSTLVGARVRGIGWTAEEFRRQLKPRLQEAFRLGELIALPRNVVTGGPKADELLVVSRRELARTSAVVDLEDWLNDPALQPQLLEIYRAIGGYVERVQWTLEDLHRYVKPRLLEAFRNKELIALAPDLLPQRSGRREAGQQTQAKPIPQPPAPPVPAHPREPPGSGAAAGPNAGREKTWIEIVLMDEAGNPVASESYRLVLPDGTVQTGKLDDKDRARVEGIDPGSCQVSFPEMDGAEWRPR